MSTRRLGVAVVAAASAVTLSVSGSLGAGSAAAAPSGCPALYVLGVQGTGQSSPDADPFSDTGMLGTILGPLKSQAGGSVERAYVPYEAGFGGAVPGGQAPYAESVQGAINRLSTMAQEVVARCSDTMLAAVGYSQGAHAVSNWAKSVGAGQNRVPASRVAAVATFGDPDRQTGAGLFPGADGQTSPSPIPGAAGTSVTRVTVSSAAAPTGGGIAPSSTQQMGYGQLTGRVASFCETGDLACDAPADAPITHILTNVAGSSELNPDDPVAAITSVAEATALMTIKAAPKIINEDFTSDDGTLASLNYTPQETVSQRLATASDPTSPMPGIDSVMQAVLKVGTIGLNAAVTVARDVVTPETVGMLATVGMANPPAALAMLGSKLLTATLKLVPPETQSRWVSQAFDAVKAEVSDNAELLNVANLAQYAQTERAHQSYGRTAATPTGAAPTQWVIQWLLAAANDLQHGDAAGATSDAEIPPTDTTPWLTAPSMSAPESAAPETTTSSAETSSAGVPDVELPTESVPTADVPATTTTP